MSELDRVNKRIRRIVIDLNQAGNYFERDDFQNFKQNLDRARINLGELVKDYS